MNFSRNEMQNLINEMAVDPTCWNNPAKINQVFTEEDMRLFDKGGFSFDSDSTAPHSNFYSYQATLATVSRRPGSSPQFKSNNRNTRRRHHLRGRGE